MTMRILLQRYLSALAATGVVLAGSVQAPAQTFRTVPGAAANYDAGAGGNAALNANLANPANRNNFGGGFYPPVYQTPYFPPTNYSVFPDPYSGYLHGGADMVRAQGQLQNDLQQAKITKQQAEQAKLDTRRKAFDQYLYERAKRPTIEDDRERSRLERIRRARNQPPLTEIWSGYALNTLLDATKKMQAQGVQGPTVPLDPYLLQKINVTTGASGGNLGLLRNGGRLAWPVTLQGPDFAAQRKKLDKLAQTAYRQADTGMVDADTVTQMNTSVDKLFRELKRNIRKVSANDYIRSKRYLNELSKSVRALDDPNVANFASGKWSARGDTVAELVRNMTGQGLRFAPATQGDENAYTALHSAMVAYYAPTNPNRPWDAAAK
jgi:hypothetical protein